MSRREHDFYETAPWQTRALLANQPISGIVLEPCAGDHSIANMLREHIAGQFFGGSTRAGRSEVITNDINRARDCHLNFDATSDALYEAVGRDIGGVDWVVTNPPYKMPDCRDIVAAAVRNARVGVAMMLRISFREPTAHVNPRGPWLHTHQPSRLLTLPRYSFTGNGKMDSATTEWVIWLKPGAEGHNLPPILSLYNADVKYANAVAEVA